MKNLLAWLIRIFGSKPEAVELQRTEPGLNRSLVMQSKKKETDQKVSKNFVYIDINSTKEVLLTQVLMEIISEPSFKEINARDKDQLKRRLDHIFNQQFDQLITRLQKKLN
jgi:hypothetical protein